VSGANDAFRCRRCLGSGPRLDQPPFPGPDGRLIADTVCASCWSEWEKREVMVINELRLNFMDPEAQETLAHAMREFLQIEEGAR
jgi:Fe-S cluster biosynthesis and repair protein YggX